MGGDGRGGGRGGRSSRSGAVESRQSGARGLGGPGPGAPGRGASGLRSALEAARATVSLDPDPSDVARAEGRARQSAVDPAATAPGSASLGRQAVRAVEEPAPPVVSPGPPEQAGDVVDRAVREEQARIRRARGRASTILAGEEPVPEERLGRSTILGI